MAEQQVFDFAIIGAGIAGATLAARLAAQGSVLLAERESQPGYHSTGRSAAMFMESYGAPQARALTRASRAAYEAAGVLAARGALYVAWRGQEGLLETGARELRETGTEIHELDAAATLRQVPVLRALDLAGALFEPDAMDLDVHALHQAGLRAARSGKAALWTGAELTAAEHSASRGAGHGKASAESGEGGWQLRFADGREARAAWLVNAAGAWADVLAGTLGLPPLGLQPRRRSAFTFDAAGLDFRAWPTTAGIDEGWYFKPDAGQLLGSPANADPVPAHDVVPEEIDIATGIARIEAHTTLSIRRPRRTWAGLRTFAPDGELVIGADPLAPRLFWLAGQGGYGIQSAAGAALLAESLILGRPLPAALQAQGVQAAAMSPARLRRAAAAT